MRHQHGSEHSWGSTCGIKPCWGYSGKASQGVGASFAAVLAVVMELQIREAKPHARNVDMGLPTCLPSLFHWNASALFHVSDGLRRSRLAFLLKHAEEVTTVCETHSCAADFPLDLGITHHIYQSHAHSSKVGGILIAIKRTFAEAEAITYHEVVAGRIAAVIIRNKLLILAGHFYAIRGYTWHELVSSASSFLNCHMHLLQIVAADINVDLCLADRIEVSTGRLHGSITPRTNHFRKHFPAEDWTEFCAGFTYNHLASSSLSAIDKFFIRCHLAELDSMNLVPRIIGAQTPPVLGDHWPITLKEQKRSSNESPLARWVGHHPDWHECFTKWLSLGVASDMTPESKYLHIIQAAETAAREIRANRQTIPPNAPHLDRHLALHALQALWKHDLHKTRTIISRAPHWDIKERSNVASLRRRLSAIVEVATTKIIEGEIDAIGSQHTDVPRRQILNKLLAMWRTKRVTPSHHEIVDENKEQCDDDRQLELVREHWRAVFQHSGGNDVRAQTVLLRYKPNVPWPPLTTITDEDIMHVIKGCPDTAPGPDRLTFKMMRPCAKTLAPWLREMLLHFLRGGCIGGGFMDSMFAFIAKPVKDQRS
eukprot:6486444-Amphidinium_carterae.2